VRTRHELVIPFIEHLLSIGAEPVGKASERALARAEPDLHEVRAQVRPSSSGEPRCSWHRRTAP